MKFRVYNPTLEPNIWNNDKTINSEVRDSLLKIAEDFYKSTDLTGEIHNILMLGSSANYNWNSKSDIDVHIVVDISEEKINEEYARKFMDTLSFKWNTEHNIEIKGHPVEVYLQDIREPNSNAEQARKGSAIYSLFDGKWVLKPEKHNIPLDVHKIQTKFKIIKKKINNVIETGDTEKLKILMKSIRNYRDAGLSKGGEFSVENLVFKSLRYSGDLKKLKDSIGSIYDKKRSLPEEGHVLAHKKTKPLNEDIESKFIIVGVINKELEILTEKDFIGGENINHEKLLKSNPTYQTGDLNTMGTWRYKSSNNTVYFSEGMSIDQRNTVLEWLHDKINVESPKQIVGNKYPESITINESLIDKNAKLYLGFIRREDFKVIGMSVDDEDWTHGMFLRSLPYEWKKLGNSEFISWRYKRKTNTVYWWLSAIHPTNDEKVEVEHWLEKNVNIKHPQHNFICTGGMYNGSIYDYERLDAHTIDETTG